MSDPDGPNQENTMENLVVISGEKNVRAAQSLARFYALKLECLGLQRGGTSVYSIVKAEMGLRGNKIRVLEQFGTYLEEEGILSPGRTASTVAALKARAQK
jgi:hypothetical protein